MSERARRPLRRTSALCLILFGLFALAGCELADDVVARPLALSSGGGSGGAGGSNGGSAGSAPRCDVNLVTVPVLPSTAGAPRQCSGWAGRRVFGHALCSCGGVEVPDALATDAVDSEDGGMESEPGGGSVGINGDYTGGDYLRVDGSLTITGNAAVTSAGGLDVGGDLRLRGAASAAGPIFVGRDAWLLGDVSTLSIASVGRDLHLGPSGALGALGAVSVGGTRTEEAFEVPAPCACEPDQLLDIAGIVADVLSTNDNQRIGLELDELSRVTVPTTLDLACGRYALRGISGRAPIALRVSGRVVLAVEGDVALPAGFSVELEPDAHLDWFVTGNLEMNPIATIGSIDRPAAVRLYAGGSNEIALLGAPTVAMNLYAPRADVSVDLAGNVYGGIFAANVRSSGLLFVHYDRAVLRADEGCRVEPPQTCASCDTCGPAATCVGNACRACATDADCCFPLVCQDDGCQPLLGD